jgi:hypothetical protein
MTRLTIACPAAYVGDANQLALALGLGPDDDKTFGAANWHDAAGNLYAVASFVASPEWVIGATSPLAMPAWGADLAAAGRAQALIRMSMPDVNTSPPLANPACLTAVVELPGGAALTLMGLRQVAEREL